MYVHVRSNIRQNGKFLILGIISYRLDTGYTQKSDVRNSYIHNISDTTEIVFTIFIQMSSMVGIFAWAKNETLNSV